MDAAAEAEFADFARSRWPRLVWLAYGLSGDQGLAEDAAQTALVKAYASWPRVHRPGDPDAYVRRIVVNASRSMFRKRRVIEQPSDTLPEPGQPDLTSQRDQRSASMTALMSLPPAQRSGVVLRYWMDMTEGPQGTHGGRRPTAGGQMPVVERG
jgi:RNA polymerase sigma-70 factor (sigma-E family)